MSEIAVFGAGFVGLSTAISLRQQGKDVILVDKETLGAGASYGNAGVIQSEAMVPYAMPRELPVLLRILLGLDTSVALRFPGVLLLIKPLASYFFNSAPKHVAQAALSYSKLIEQSTQAHFDLAEQAGAQAQFRSGGYRLRFTQAREMDSTLRSFSEMARAYDLPLSVLSPEAFAKAEPGVADTGIGALEWSAPHHVERPDQLLQSYFEYFLSIGGGLIQGDALSLIANRSGWSFTGAQGAHTAEQVVIATGAQTVQIAKHLGGRVPIVPKRGYHAVLSGGRRLNAPLVDAEFGFVYSPQGDCIRVATGAELGGKAAKSNSRQLTAAINQAAHLFGTDTTPATTWSGLRPCMSDMLPVMGKSQRHKGLWFNFGHGHQGLTMGPLAGNLLANGLLGHQELDPALSPARYSL